MQVSHWKNAKPYPSLLGGKGDGSSPLLFLFIYASILAGTSDLTYITAAGIVP